MAVDEHGSVLDIMLQRHRDPEAAKTFLTRLLGEYDVPEVIHTDQLRSYGAAIREIPTLIHVDHQQVISTARCNNMIEQSHRPTRRQERQRESVLMGRSGVFKRVRSRRQLFCPRQQQGFKRGKRVQEFLHLHSRIGGQASSSAPVCPRQNLHHHARTNVSATTRRNNQRQAFQTWSMVAAGVT